MAALPRLLEAKVPTEERLRGIFQTCDLDSNGRINKREFIKSLRSHQDVAHFFGLPTEIHQEDGSRDQMERMFQQMDANSDREITWEEFQAFYAKGAAPPAARAPRDGAAAAAPRGKGAAPASRAGPAQPGARQPGARSAPRAPGRRAAAEGSRRAAPTSTAPAARRRPAAPAPQSAEDTADSSDDSSDDGEGLGGIFGFVFRRAGSRRSSEGDSGQSDSSDE